MIDAVLFASTLAAALGSALVAGVFFAFSTFVMAALARLPAPQGIAAMQSINVAAINPWFMTTLLGTCVLCVVLAVAALLMWQRPGAGYLLAGGLLYVVGAIAVTRLCNVPRNNALAAVDPASAGGAVLWADYLETWTAWNHVRTVTPVVAAVLLFLALLKGPAT